MQIAEFTYTDAKKKQTTRIVVPLSTCDEYIMAIDLKELGNEDIGIFAAKFDNIAAENFDADVVKLMQEFDIKYALRKFKTVNIANYSVEVV